MSVQFGRWSFDGMPAAPRYLEEAGKLLAPYGPDGNGSYSGPGVDILYRPFHTTKESRREKQPHVSASGTVITWDGRLDNRKELVRQLDGQVTRESTDVAIVAAAYERWGTNSFAKLIGDWALSIWNPRNRELILAKDFLGARHLYYASDDNQITWSTILDPLVLLAGKTFVLEEEYIAGWLAFFPATHLTPYVGIHSVSPSTFVHIRPGKQTVTKYWDFDPRKRIRYSSDGEYEEHFRTVFGESVRRRLRSDSPILAELSGGMDSSSIVCMADRIIAQGRAETPRLDTISYYNDSEPNWNEKPYFTKVEEKRGRTGCHIDLDCQNPFGSEFEVGRFAAAPNCRTRSSLFDKQFSELMGLAGYRAVLSGIGGDEVTGGVPTPMPQLADCLAKARFLSLALQLKVWALNGRKPWLHLLIEAVRGFLPPILTIPKHLEPARWIHPDFVRRHRAALSGYPSRLKLFGPLPSFQENISAFNSLRRQLESAPFAPGVPYEMQYPFLDRDFLEFICAVPRGEIVRPRQRRSLMRRALGGMVPIELLGRRRKAYAGRTSTKFISSGQDISIQLVQPMVVSLLGFVDQERLSGALQSIKNGHQIPIVSLIRTLGIEFWLRCDACRNIFTHYKSPGPCASATFSRKSMQSEPLT
ncbi:MAG TPA: asparagine synthase-related protein [Candidatus Acidoferrales bacterium]|nr:asparagine synthase-related protein [Candidatus Acidoferrales bacterium]